MSDFRPCRECKDWNTCLLTEGEKDWFGYQDITFCPQHIFWLLKYEHIIRGRKWPEPDETAIGGMSGKSMSWAAFTKASTLLAEVYSRLDATGLRGKLLSAECKDYQREKIQYLSDDAKSALYYITRKPKDRQFSQWVADRRYARKSDKNITHLTT